MAAGHQPTQSRCIHTGDPAYPPEFFGRGEVGEKGIVHADTRLETHLEPLNQRMVLNARHDTGLNIGRDTRLQSHLVPNG